MSFLGMDIAAAQHQAELLRAQAVEELASIITATDGLIGQLEGCWKGADAERFISTWRGTQLGALQVVQQALSNFHDELGKNIAAQISASGG